MGAGRLPGPIGVASDALGRHGYDWQEGPVERRRSGLVHGTPVVIAKHPTWTTIGAILNAFFAPTDMGERLWVMPETDSYTRIVRRWGPVLRHLDALKREVVSRPIEWQQQHKTIARWKPQYGHVPPPNCGWDELERTPPGTDPETARENFMVFMATGFATEALHTSSIGSFRVMATADEVEMSVRKIILNVWMYNEMSARSFGRFAHEWPFDGLPMRSQFMWWNWKEKFSFDENGNIEATYRGNLAF